MSTRPEGHEFVKPIIFKFGDGASYIVGTRGGGLVDDNLLQIYLYFFDVTEFSNVCIFRGKLFTC